LLILARKLLLVSLSTIKKLYKVTMTVFKEFVTVALIKENRQKLDIEL
jgi:hypothetical protein